MDHTDRVRDLTFAPDGSLVLVSASRDKTLRVWDLKDDGRNVQCSKPLLSGTFDHFHRFSPFQLFMCTLTLKEAQEVLQEVLAP